METFTSRVLLSLLVKGRKWNFGTTTMRKAIIKPQVFTEDWGMPHKADTSFSFLDKLAMAVIGLGAIVVLAHPLIISFIK